MKADDLIAKIRAHGASELEPLYIEYRSEFVGWLKKRHSIESSEGKEIYQQAILTLYENVISGRLTHFSSSIKTYLFAVGKNKVMEWQRKNKGQIYVDHDFELMEDDDNLAITRDADLTIIENAFSSLGNPCEELLKRFYYDQWSIDQITQVFGYKNSDTTKNRKYKCLQRLKKLCITIRSTNDE